MWGSIAVSNRFFEKLMQVCHDMSVVMTPQEKPGALRGSQSGCWAHLRMAG